MIKKLWVIILAGVLLFTSCPVGLAGHEEMSGGKYYTLVDENSNVIHQTGMRVYEGDEYISTDNSRYKVVEVIGDKARCVYQGQERLPSLSFNQQKNAWFFTDQSVPAANPGKKPTVAVYHTHSDESYVPTDGKESINGNGGIYDVGQVFVNQLRELGLNVDYNVNNHNPHDINAYNRSRRTALQLIRKTAPDAVIDIHRDAVPASQYSAEVNGKEVTKVKLVVGRTNPNMKTNLEFAKRIKAVMDKQTPGLSNGIFLGKGDYNQDLSPRSMLIEVGAHTNNKTDAEKGVRLFANTVPVALGVSNVQGTTPAAKPALGNSQGSGTTVLIILVALAAAAAGYYFLNKGSVKK